MDAENKLGKKIKELRKSFGYTQQYLAELADIDDKHLSKIENGIHLPTYITLKKLSEVLCFNLQDMDSVSNKESIANNPIFQKSLRILSAAKNDIELQNYYDTLKLAQKLMNETNISIDPNKKKCNN